MSPKKSSGPKKLRPIGKLAAKLEKQAKADAEKRPQFRPLGDVGKQIRKALKKKKANRE